MSIREYLEDFIDHVATLEQEDNNFVDGFEKEFLKLKEISINIKSDGTLPCTHGQQDYNRKKNRYKDILPFDNTRVVLNNIPGVQGSDYINANFIKGNHGFDSYIASQAPLPHTVDDFWRMLWQYKIKVIVMACNLVEGEKPKCEKYWADNPSERSEFAGIKVTGKISDKYPTSSDFQVRILTAQKDDVTRKIFQFHYSAWPDHGVPHHFGPILDMVALIREEQPQESHPVVIHCSAGCGRTGTICAIDYCWSLLKQGKLDAKFSLYEIIRRMREQRPSTVQTREQYWLVHEAVKELFQLHIQELDSHYYVNVNMSTGQSLAGQENDAVGVYENCEIGKQSGEDHYSVPSSSPILTRGKPQASAYEEVHVSRSPREQSVLKSLATLEIMRKQNRSNQKTGAKRPDTIPTSNTGLKPKLSPKPSIDSDKGSPVLTSHSPHSSPKPSPNVKPGHLRTLSGEFKKETTRDSFGKGLKKFSLDSSQDLEKRASPPVKKLSLDKMFPFLGSSAEEGSPKQAQPVSFHLDASNESRPRCSSIEKRKHAFESTASGLAGSQQEAKTVQGPVKLQKTPTDTHRGLPEYINVSSEIEANRLQIEDTVSKNPRRAIFDKSSVSSEGEVFVDIKHPEAGVPYGNVTKSSISNIEQIEQKLEISNRSAIIDLESAQERDIVSFSRNTDYEPIFFDEPKPSKDVKTEHHGNVSNLKSKVGNELERTLAVRKGPKESDNVAKKDKKHKKHSVDASQVPIKTASNQEKSSSNKDHGKIPVLPANTTLELEKKMAAGQPSKAEISSKKPQAVKKNSADKIQVLPTNFVQSPVKIAQDYAEPFQAGTKPGTVPKQAILPQSRHVYSEPYELKAQTKKTKDGKPTLIIHTTDIPKERPISAVKPGVDSDNQDSMLTNRPAPAIPAQWKNRVYAEPYEHEPNTQPKSAHGNTTFPEYSDPFDESTTAPNKEYAYVDSAQPGKWALENLEKRKNEGTAHHTLQQSADPVAPPRRKRSSNSEFCEYETVTVSESPSPRLAREHHKPNNDSGLAYASSSLVGPNQSTSTEPSSSPPPVPMKSAESYQDAEENISDSDVEEEIQHFWEVDEPPPVPVKTPEAFIPYESASSKCHKDHVYMPPSPLVSQRDNRCHTLSKDFFSSRRRKASRSASAAGDNGKTKTGSSNFLGKMSEQLKSKVQALGNLNNQSHQDNGIAEGKQVGIGGPVKYKEKPIDFKHRVGKPKGPRDTPQGTLWKIINKLQ